MSALQKAWSSSGFRWVALGWTGFITENLVLSENRTAIISSIGDDRYHLAYSSLSLLSCSTIGKRLWGHLLASCPVPTCIAAAALRLLCPPSKHLASALSRLRVFLFLNPDYLKPSLDPTNNQRMACGGMARGLSSVRSGLQDSLVPSRCNRLVWLAPRNLFLNCNCQSPMQGREEEEEEQQEGAAHHPSTPDRTPPHAQHPAREAVSGSGRSARWTSVQQTR